MKKILLASLLFSYEVKSASSLRFYIEGLAGASKIGRSIKGFNSTRAQNIQMWNWLRPEGYFLGYVDDVTTIKPLKNFTLGGMFGGALGLDYILPKTCWVLGGYVGGQFLSSSYGVNYELFVPEKFTPQTYGLYGYGTMEGSVSAKGGFRAGVRLGYKVANFLPFVSLGCLGSRFKVCLMDASSTNHTKHNFITGLALGGGCEYDLSRCFSLGFLAEWMGAKKKRYSFPEFAVSSGYTNNPNRNFLGIDPQTAIQIKPRLSQLLLTLKYRLSVF